MSETTSGFEDFITDNKIVTAELPDKIKTKIAKFATVTDPSLKEDADAVIYDLLEEYLEAKVKAEKIAGAKTKIADNKKNKLDVSGAATAKTPEQEEAEKKAADAKKEPSLLKKYYGLGE